MPKSDLPLPWWRKPILGLAVLYCVLWGLAFRLAAPTWDAAFYYGFARSIVMDGDIDLENDLLLSYPTSAPDFVSAQLHRERTSTGAVAAPFAIGSAILWLPWFILLKLGAGLGLGPGTATGYETFYVVGVATLSSLCGWLAFVVGIKLARDETGRGSAIASALTLMVATPLVYYQFQEPLYAHATAALVTGICVYVWWRRRHMGPSVKQALLLGGLIGFATLVRWQHIAYLALPVISNWYRWYGLPVGERRSQRWAHLSYLLCVMGMALFVTSIQLAAWKQIYGQWLTVPQGAAYMDWTGAPFLIPMLFSTYRGLFTWMPVIVPALIGLILLVGKKPGLALPLIVVLLLETWVNASSHDWFGGGGFGPRRFTSELVILIVGYAALLDRLAPRVGSLVAGVTGLGLGLHQWILLRFALYEDIGGRKLSLYPTYRWSEVSLATFVRQIAVHLGDLARPIDFFVLPGSPVAKLRMRDWPLPELIALVVVSGLLLLGWKGVEWLRQAPKRRLAAERALAALSLAAIVAADIWLLV